MLNKTAMEMIDDEPENEPENPSYSEQLAELAQALSGGGDFNLSALRLMEFIGRNSYQLKSELLGIYDAML